MLLSHEDSELLLSSFEEGSRARSLLVVLVHGPIEVCRLNFRCEASSIGGLNSSLKRKKLPFKVFCTPEEEPWSNKDLCLKRIPV